MIGMLQDPLMQRALLIAVLVGVAAPVVGTYMVQRKMSLLGDGIGHVALTGVAAGWLVGNWAEAGARGAWAVPGAIIFAVAGAVTIEHLRAKGIVAADVILAVMFYGGIAGGVLFIGLAGGTGSNLLAYLFGSISTVTTGDLILTLILAGAILIFGLGLKDALFSVSHDTEFARTTGLPVHLLNIAVAVAAALTITLAMRVVGLVLVSGLMIVPVAIAQLLVKSFGATMRLAMAIGGLVALSGLTITYFYDIQPGALIVFMAVSGYAIVGLGKSLVRLKKP